MEVFNNLHHTNGMVVSGRIKQESQGSRTTLSATRQEVPKNIQKPYTLVTFDEMHQKIFVDGAMFLLGKQKEPDSHPDQV